MYNPESGPHLFCTVRSGPGSGLVRTGAGPDPDLSSGPDPDLFRSGPDLKSGSESVCKRRGNLMSFLLKAH